jgi:hypothetical protein
VTGQPEYYAGTVNHLQNASAEIPVSSNKDGPGLGAGEGAEVEGSAVVSGISLGLDKRSANIPKASLESPVSSARDIFWMPAPSRVPGWEGKATDMLHQV